MKSIQLDEIDRLPGRRLGPTDTFTFRCHPRIGCFNRCCRNLNLFLYPYDVVRLKKSLGISSDTFIERHVDVVMREGNFFPDVLLKMAENEARTCPFLSEAGCRVYPDRPDACRTFPLELGRIYGEHGQRPEPVCFFRPPDFCQGPAESTPWTLDSWVADQQAAPYHRMTAKWAALKQRFAVDPWGGSGMEGPKAKMAFMVSYNVDRFREFVFNSTFLKRYKVASKVLKSAQKSDSALMLLGFSWIRCFVWGERVPEITVRKGL